MNPEYRQGDKVAVHRAPVWREKSNFIIRAFIEKIDDRSRWEQLWVRKIRQTSFEVCCIPFFVYELSLGDIVETDSNFNLQQVTERSGFHTFRVWIEESDAPFDRVNFISLLIRYGALYEWSTEHLLAISTVTDEQTCAVRDLLIAMSDQRSIQYEIGSG